MVDSDLSSGGCQWCGGAGPDVSGFFPCYNEQHNISAVVRQATDVLEGLGLDYELIIVDDGSTDGTAQIAQQLAASNPRIKVVRHGVNRGYGAALRSGFGAARGELVFFVDADGQFDLGDLPRFLEAVRDCDVVCGYRQRRSDGLVRRINGWCWTRLVCAVFAFRVTDVDCGFKLFRHRVITGMKLLSDGALISAEILARATRAGYKIVELPVRHYRRQSGRQTGASPKVILRAFLELLRLRRRIVGG